MTPYHTTSKLSGLVWRDNLIPSQQHSSSSSCSQPRSLRFSPVGFLLRSFLFPHLPPFVQANPTHPLIPHFPCVKFSGTTPEKDSLHFPWRRHACVLWPVSHLPHILIFFSPNFWQFTLASEAERLVSIQTVHSGQQELRNNRISICEVNLHDQRLQ